MKHPSDVQAVELSDGYSPKMRVLAALSSIFLPGLGQWELGQKLEAITFLALWILWWVLFVFLRLPLTYLGWVSAVVCGLIIVMIATWRALRSLSNGQKAAQIWWLFLMLPIAILGFGCWINPAMHLAGFRGFSVPSTSMAPTIQSNDRIIADMRFYHHQPPRQGSVVLIQRPNHVIVVKRIIAVSGDMLSSEENRIVINGQARDESYVQHTGDAPKYLRTFGPIHLQQHKFFVMGDNRDLSLDSRSSEFGLIDESAIIGKPLYIINPSGNQLSKIIH